MSTITIVCSGQMGSALSFPLIENSHEVRLVGSPLDDEIIETLKESNFHKNLDRELPKGLKYYTVDQLEEALENTDLVVCGASSFGVDWVKDNLLPIIPENTPMISVTKGMIWDDETYKNYPTYWKDHLPENKEQRFYAIGGPCTARGLADHDVSFVAFCGEDQEELKWIKSLFDRPYYLISTTDDIDGLEAAVALKNGYALATALAIGLKNKDPNFVGTGVNSKSALFQQSVLEMLKLIQLFGGNVENIMYAAGDLDVTVAEGRSRRVGILLGEGYDIDQAQEALAGETLEAVVIAKRTAEAVKKLSEQGKAETKDFPLLMHLDEILNEKMEVHIPWKDFERE